MIVLLLHVSIKNLSPNITNRYPKLVFWCKIIATYLRENLLHFLQLQESIRIGVAKCFRSEMTWHLILGVRDPRVREGSLFFYQSPRQTIRLFYFNHFYTVNFTTPAPSELNRPLSG